MSAIRQEETETEAPAEIIIDFRYAGDDAWYSAAAASGKNGQVLKVMYMNFSENLDEKYRADMFENEEELVEFGKRFRRGSVQLQDHECKVVCKGMIVCVAYQFEEKDTRFYDAVVDSVNSKVHSKDEGRCTCTFDVVWQHGPLVGKRTATGIENICLLQPKKFKIDPTVTKFLETARKKLKDRKFQGNQTNTYFQENSEQNIECDPCDHCDNSNLKYDFQGNQTNDYLQENPGQNIESDLGDIHCDNSNSKYDFQGNQTNAYFQENLRQNIKIDPCDIHCANSNMKYDTAEINGSCPVAPLGSPVGSQLKRCSRLKRTSSLTHTCGSAKKSSLSMQIDATDRGSNLAHKTALPKDIHYFFRIENLEKSLSAFDIINFIFEKTSVSCHAFICPAAIEEYFSRATILVETEAAANKLYEFLHDTSHIITSLGGRPWISDEKWCGCADGMMPRYKMPLSNRSKGNPSKLKLVFRGSKEYEQAKRLQARHEEFHDNIRKNLLQKLKEDEKSKSLR